mmetsp:Transcript_106329/g.216848  ORF Transcript_106329/g.216848 Transcript_106329/m.216848 type:complete len:624 (-) Transcript_106329:664-2535(-)|eukprot:CAMPEP_0201201436 /NCGR_PEP_ID=MMETSP0851-20130426/162953_1 /ASSEMBLY_ACC=CAM_ASM_000631 /TAXON_ID=183588 /ORGANISM="Pseudo-nitzschia fraudulenta, Strain WWA7" /LENGTH=623 /DNA_ID=CAMNT_0047489133 /DNA_START=181 /DNA_END=2052 /DNA_ORIENTATION=-
MAKLRSEYDEKKDDQDETSQSGPVLCNKLAAGHAAHKQMNTFSQISRLHRFDEEVHHVSWNSIRRKNLLGQGAFSLVFKVQVTAGDDPTKTTTLSNQKYYALKHIKPDITGDSKDFRVAAIDLAVEGEILSRLRHENIIKLHGVYGGNPSTAFKDFKDGYFLLIDILDDTLTRRLQKMRKTAKKKRRSGNSTMLEVIQTTAIGIAKGLEYLHENNVILRDLKPDNVGFDENGTPIIFDLGFARELHTVHKSEVAGSLRYMSPEIGLSQGASLASDVYSFGVLLFELCTLEKPFKIYKGRPEFIEDVFLHNFRPDVTSISSKAIKDLISNCWDKDQAKRPSMKTVGKVLRVETALLNVQQPTRTTGLKESILRRSEQSVPSMNTLGSLGSFRPLTRSCGRRSSSTSIPTTSMNSTTARSSNCINSVNRRNSIIRRMSGENFNWNSDVRTSQESSVNHSGNRTMRRRNSLTSSLFDRRRSSASSGSLAAEVGPLNDIEETSPSGNNTRVQSNHRLNRGLTSSCYRARSDSTSSFLSMSGDSSTDMSVSNFTLGEFKPRRMGMSRRNSFFPSISSRGLFTIDIDHGSGGAEDNNNSDSVLADEDCTRDPSSVSSEGGLITEPKPAQ